MRRPNDARAAALALATSLLCALAPAWAARVVQDGVVLDGVPELNPQIGASLARYRGGSESRLLDWLSDGSLLVAVRREGRDQLLRLRGAAAAREPIGVPGIRLRTVTAAQFQSDTVALLGDDPQGGNALYLLQLANGAMRALLPASAHVGMPAWAHDGRQLAFSATLASTTAVDGAAAGAPASGLYVLDTAGNAAPRLVASADSADGGAASWQVLAWTSADRSLLVKHRVSDAGDELLLLDLTSGALRRVDAPGERAPGYGHIGAARLTSDGRGVYFTSDRGSEHAQLRYLDFYAGTATVVAPDVDIEQFDVSADNRTLALSWNEFGYSRVALLDRPSGRMSTLSTLPPGVVDALRFDHAGARLAIELASSAGPRDVYVHEPGSATSARWTASQLGVFSATQLVAPQSVRFPTWDRVATGNQRMLTALLYRPRARGPWPVVVMLGDAGADARVQLDPFVQYCVNELGLAVVIPGLRTGETGGLDMGALLAWLGAQPDLRRERGAVQGSGSGGTLALLALALYGDRLRGAVDVDGAASSAQLTALRSPVLLVRGLHAPALDAGAAEQLLWRLRSAGVESWFVAPRELGGQLADEPGQAAAQRVIAQFLRAKLAE
ncbi:MAG: PD40 domain-containing protein [Gammaproteobacteria bacterium]|nr:PD40 domain-containing protein [Gammaproteobacteria bacterium]